MMKEKCMRFLSLLLCFSLVLLLNTPPAAGASEPELFLALQTPKIAKSDQDQKVILEIHLRTQKDYTGFAGLLVLPEPLKLAGLSREFIVPSMQSRETALRLVDPPTAGQTGDVLIGTAEIIVPAGTPVGKYVLSVKEAEFGSGKDICGPVVLQTELEIADRLPEMPNGFSAALSGPASATAGDELTYQLSVSGGEFSAAQAVLQYPQELLEYLPGTAKVSVSGGRLTLADHGTRKTSPYIYALHFRAKADGDAILKLQSAAFGTSESAASNDLTAAAVTADTVRTAIMKKTYPVTLPSFFRGFDTAADGEAYSFEAVDKNPAHYRYTDVRAQAGGTAVAVTDHGDGTYSVASVSGPLAISAVQTPVSYAVHFATETGVRLPSDSTASYGTDFRFALPREEHYTVTLTSVTIGGKAASFSHTDGVVVIPGDQIVGNLEILLNKVQADAVVTVEGSGAGDTEPLPGYAIPEKELTLTLRPDARYLYEVTAAVNGTPAALTGSGNRYILDASSVIPGKIVFTVTKTIRTDGLAASSYLQLDGTVVWLVENKTARSADSVYVYSGQTMYWSSKYNAYCTLVIGSAKPELNASLLTLSAGSPCDVPYSALDPNNTGRTDANDAQFVYNLYNGLYRGFDRTITVEKLLRADVNGDRCVNVTDSAAIIDAILH